MEEKNQKKMDIISQQLSKLKNILHNQQNIIELLSKLQLEMMETDENSFSDRVGELFSNASQNHEALKKIIEDYEIVFNQYKNKFS